MTATTLAPATLTRRSAIDTAFQTYLTLSERALRRAGKNAAQKRYVKAVSDVWLRRLSELGEVGRLDTSLPEHTSNRVESLTSAVNVRLSDNDLYRWLDVFPEAIAELLPPSASTFRAEGTNVSGSAEDQLATLIRALAA